MAFKRTAIRTTTPSDAQKYAIISDKLVLTITCFKDKYHELGELFLNIERIPLDYTHLNPFVDRLAKICDHMEELATTSYVIRHMHHNLSNDLRNLQEGSMLNDDRELYIETAN